MEDEPIYGFSNYSDTISKIIRGSKPAFSIGIYGDWGTGKTTLMKLVQKNLEKDKDILTVWFNAWRYEREDKFALIALMKTISFAMKNIPHYRQIKRVLLRSALILGKDITKNIIEKSIPVISKERLDSIEKEILPRMDHISQMDKDTIYFDGLYKVEKEMEKISKEKGGRIVVFIDDLDRCSPKTALEVFESIKVFLGMEGFIYVVGLSINTISNLIEVSYKDSIVRGEHYLRKVIQIPITLPDWANENIVKDLAKKVSSKLDNKYQKIVADNVDIISKAVEFNPREIKRFINSFIISHQLFSNNNIEAKDLLLIQALKFRWRNFELDLLFNSKFQREFQKYASLPEDERNEKINSRKKDTTKPLEFSERKVFELESDPVFWDFLIKNSKILFQIKDWKIYHDVIESLNADGNVKEMFSAQDEKLQLTKLLKAERIVEFNRLRERFDFSPITLVMVNLMGRNLRKVDLRRADLRGSILIKANMSESNLVGADLSKANLKGVDLSGAILTGSNLIETDFSTAFFWGADLTQADLSGSTLERAVLNSCTFYQANLSNTNFSKADLRKSNFAEADLTGANLQEADLKDTDLSKAILTRTDLRESKNLPISREEVIRRGAIV